MVQLIEYLRNLTVLFRIPAKMRGNHLPLPAQFPNLVHSLTRAGAWNHVNSVWTVVDVQWGTMR